MTTSQLYRPSYPRVELVIFVNDPTPAGIQQLVRYYRAIVVSGYYVEEYSRTNGTFYYASAYPIERLIFLVVSQLHKHR